MVLCTCSSYDSNLSGARFHSLCLFIMFIFQTKVWISNVYSISLFAFDVKCLIYYFVLLQYKVCFVAHFLFIILFFFLLANQWFWKLYVTQNCQTTSLFWCPLMIELNIFIFNKKENLKLLSYSWYLQNFYRFP